MTHSIPLVALSLLLAAQGALAAQRTFVASNGLDTNACSIAAPCRSFTTALAHTDPSGEIIVLDSAGYGAVTITQSVSIIAPAGVYAGISVFSGNGVTVNGAGIGVALRGLSINGQGGTSGIVVTDAAVVSIERCTVTGMPTHGLHATAANATVLVADSVFEGNGSTGLRFDGSLTATVHRVRSEGNGGNGLFALNGASVAVSESVASRNGGDGMSAFTNSNVTTRLAITDSYVSGHLSDAMGIRAFTNGAVGTVILNVTRTTVTRNTAGIGAQESMGTTVYATVSDSTISAHAFDGINVSGGAILAASNNTIANNATGVDNSGSTFLTRENNTSAGNATAISGSFTPLSGF
jgi:hypothetical protein